MSGARTDAFFTNPAEAAPREGLGRVRQGLGLTFKPYGLLSPAKDHVAGTPADWRWDPAAHFVPLQERGVFKLTLSIRP